MYTTYGYGHYGTPYIILLIIKFLININRISKYRKLQHINIACGNKMRDRASFVVLNIILRDVQVGNFATSFFFLVLP